MAYIFLIIKLNNQRNFNMLYFKLLSMLTFSCFVFIFLLNNDILFFVPSIAVLISLQSLLVLLR